MKEHKRQASRSVQLELTLNLSDRTSFHLVPIYNSIQEKIRELLLIR